MNDRLSEVSNMPTKEQKPLLGTKGARQGPQTLTDLSTPLLIGVDIQRNVILDTDIRSEVTNRDPVGLPIWMLPNVMWLYTILERAEGKGGVFEGRGLQR